LKIKIFENKGVSLIEILVSLAIVSIMIFPISSMINTALKTNKKSEIRQQGMLIGQQILEEIEVLQQVSKDKLDLSGGELIGSNKNNDIKSMYESQNYKKGNSSYNVSVQLEENKDLTYDDFDKNQINTSNIKDKFLLETDSTNSNIIIGKDGIYNSIYIDRNNPILNIEFSSENGINNMNIEGINNTFRISSNRILFDFTDKYKIENGITINVTNNLSNPIDLYVKKSNEGKEKVYIEKRYGEVRVNNIASSSETEDLSMNKLYNITVEVKKNGKELFKGHGNKNINITN
jgi:prepilin-type N-terminal cleavage/methylation domain-containing protein